MQGFKKNFDKPLIDYNDLLIEFKELLKKNNLKYTKQRELILKALYQNNGHFSPEFLYNLVQEEDKKVNISIATVYRTLTLLEDGGLVSSVTFGGGKKYEFGIKAHHDHLICIKCGKIVEFCDEEIENRQDEIAKFFKFKMTNHSMKIYGLCEKCQKKG